MVRYEPALPVAGSRLALGPTMEEPRLSPHPMPHPHSFYWLAQLRHAVLLPERVHPRLHCGLLRVPHGVPANHFFVNPFLEKPLHMTANYHIRAAATYVACKGNYNKGGVKYDIHARKGVRLEINCYNRLLAGNTLSRANLPGRLRVLWSAAPPALPVVSAWLAGELRHHHRQLFQCSAGPRLPIPLLPSWGTLISLPVHGGFPFAPLTQLAAA